MRRRRSTDDGLEEEEDDEPSGPPRAHHRGHGRPRAAPVRPWSAKADESAETSEEDTSGARRSWFHRPRRPVFYRARDSLYFEPLVALAIILLLLVSLWAYTQNWPPMYVVESNSMQHGNIDQLGLINTGDLVLAQKIDPNQITPYMVGLQTKYTTYGEYGDVILYHPDGLTSPAPIIHRALLFLVYNTDGSYSFPSLQGLPCGSQPGATYTISPNPSHCGWSHVTGTLTLLNVGWKSVNVSVDLGSAGGHSGFLTMGDNNLDPGDPTRGTVDQPALSSLVEPAWVVGVARGMLPWFGAVKLLLQGQATEVPPQSWQFMAITIIALVLGGLLFHYALRTGRRDDDPIETDEEEDDVDEPPARSRWPSLSRWRGRSADEEEEEPEAPVTRHGSSRSPSLPRRGGRPHPAVKRGHRARGAPKDEPENGDL